MNCFLVGVKDPLISIRASSLSNLAELCKHMRFALHPYIVDIMECLYYVLTSEKEAEIRRGGVFVFTLLLRGLKSDIIQLIPDYLKKIYQSLKRICDSDSDDITKFHANEALYELGIIVQSLFTPNQLPDLNRFKIS
jgi:hypothetical protein